MIGARPIATEDGDGFATGFVLAARSQIGYCYRNVMYWCGSFDRGVFERFAFSVARNAVGGRFVPRL